MKEGMKMDNNALFKIAYGLFVLTANDGEKDNGCIVNTLAQVTSSPLQVTVAVNKLNYTHDIISNTGKFTASVISEGANFDLFKRFGFQSGKTVDKFKDFSDVVRTDNGTLAVTLGTNAYICADVTQKIDVGSHTIFLANVTDAKILSDTPSATYTYYQEHIKPKASAKPVSSKTVWRCKICGYEYEGDELPDDFVCPICKHGKIDFEKL